VGRETDPGKVQLIAYFVAVGSPPVSTRSLRATLAQRLPDYMMPSAFVEVTEIPQTPNGKADRLRLPPPTPVGRDSTRPLTAPRTPIETGLVAIWKEVLDIDALSIDDDILSLGGDSLKAARIAEAAAMHFGLPVPASAPLRLETVERMAELFAPDRATPKHR